MSTKITVNGRTWKSPDWREPRRYTAEDVEILNTPIAEGTPRAALAETLTEDGVSYRLVDELDPAQGWCLASQLVTHFAIDWAELRRWCLEGLIDCATVRGSSVRRYRPAVPTRVLLARATAWHAGAPERAVGYGLKPGRGARRR